MVIVFLLGRGDAFKRKVMHVHLLSIYNFLLETVTSF